MSSDTPFLGQAPISPQTWNLFAYGMNNPMKYIDPTGHAPTRDMPIENPGDLAGWQSHLDQFEHDYNEALEEHVAVC